MWITLYWFSTQKLSYVKSVLYLLTEDKTSQTIMYLKSTSNMLSLPLSLYIYNGYIRSKFIHWAFWRTLMRTGYFLFVHHTTSILAKFSTWSFEHSGDISCSVLVDLSHTNESWKRGNTCLQIYTNIHTHIYIYNIIYNNIYNIYIIYIYIYIASRVPINKNSLKGYSFYLVFPFVSKSLS